ncbi:DUF1989 domain-containing protein [Ancylobacter terrae]|uniref:DUF1989 domain-containing protein n=1 Tax=Ancylobacter sp. sgz301288 TaxID=3342077 RepID=UPI00385F6751
MSDVTIEPVANLQTIPARRGASAYVSRGACVRVINTHGKQVVDTWAFNAVDIEEHLSMEHSRASLLRIIPKVGDTLVSNRRNPMLSVVEDTTPGIHDLLIAACDEHRYRQLGAVGHHDSCTDNLRDELAKRGVSGRGTPSPLNLFMNVPVHADGRLSFQPPVSQAGQYVTLRAEMDLIVVFSACPQDMIPVNDMRPTDAHFVVI